MRSYSLLLSALALAITSASAQAIDRDDVPSACLSACGPVVAASDVCEEQDDDGDDSEWTCVCNAQGMSSAVSDCMSCLQSNPTSDDDDDDDGEFGELIGYLGSCGFGAGSGGSSSSAGTSTQTSGQSTTGGSVSATPAASGSAADGTQTTASSDGSASASPSMTAGPSQSRGAESSDLDGSVLTVVTATRGSGDDAEVATLTSVVPGPVVTEDQAAAEVIDNGGRRPGAPAAAAAFGFLVAML